MTQETARPTARRGTSFDPCAPLPTGSVVLEASAGTGKTHTIASLTLHYLAEGVVRLPQMLLVTFGRSATSELRDRVRARLVAAERALRDPAQARTSDDEVVAYLATADTTADVTTRHRRLVDALADFDAATITTTHGFCEQMLLALGMQADRDPDATFLADVATLREEVVDDLYLRKYAADPHPRLDVAQARTIARVAVGDHVAQIVPQDPPPGWAKDATGLARAVRAELTARKRAAGLVDYDDLLTGLRDALDDPVTGATARARVRERYRVVIVDEFQDTDPVQWQILRTAFHEPDGTVGDGTRALVLVGDPKQAIYAFRGADVVTYLDAVREIGATRTLDRTWRTDAAVLDGLWPVLGDAALGDPAIRVRPVEAVHTTRRITGIPPVLLRRVTRAAFPATTREPAVADVRALLYADVVTQVQRVLRDAVVHDDSGTRPVRPDEIAVLARTRDDVEQVHAALRAVGVPAVSSVLPSVFRSPAAHDWQVLLTALATPGYPGYEAAAALTPFVGWDAHRLGTATSTDRDRLAARLRHWSRVLADAGVAALVEAVEQTGLALRLVALSDGPRRLADVRHIGEALHTAASAGGLTPGRLGASALLEWLAARRAEAAADYDETRSRRLETDAEAVQVLTVHAAKGLEFPVVLVPFQANRHFGTDDPTLSLHRDGVRVLDVGGTDGPDRADAQERADAEAAGEDLRLTYVALTRAASAVLVWWSPATTSARAPLTRLLFGEREPDGSLPTAVPTPSDRQVGQHLAALAVPDALVVETVETRPRLNPSGGRWSAPAPDQPLTVATFDRTVDPDWRRTSYSALTADAHEGRTVPETPQIADEPDDPQPAAPADDPDSAVCGTSSDALRQVASPLADLPAGTAFGTFVHAVLEVVDTAAVDLDGEIATRVAQVGTAGLGTLADLEPDQVAAALAPLYSTPLGPLADNRALAQVPPSDRLAELDFELPLAGGEAADSRTSRATLRDVADLLRTHLAPDDPFTPYADRLTDGSVAADRPLAGYLTGSIDALLRLTSPLSADDAPRGARSAPEARFVVVDYKTNRLGPLDEPLTCWHYRPAALVAAMLDAHYPLQLLLYSVAAHRYLRWRLPRYDPDTHLGGGLYLFVRGMAGPATPVVDGTPCGVMGWRPPSALVTDLSDLLAGRTEVSR
ncbi:MAG: UvrD-helicase domain-containing protein [Micrococcales bacterium]|nr:UvrD-helicase domain-containing protein [Micrococcales bacterium]